MVYCSFPAQRSDLIEYNYSVHTTPNDEPSQITYNIPYSFSQNTEYDPPDFDARISTISKENLQRHPQLCASTLREKQQYGHGAFKYTPEHSFDSYYRLAQASYRGNTSVKGYLAAHPSDFRYVGVEDMHAGTGGTFRLAFATDGAGLYVGIEGTSSLRIFFSTPKSPSPTR